MGAPMFGSLEVRQVAPGGRRVTRVKLDGVTCAKCRRELRRGDRVAIENGRLVHPKDRPCVPTWESP
jgi:hypothetical protein